MKYLRRVFLKFTATAVLLALQIGKGLGLTYYYMQPGEVLYGLRYPPWAKIVMADNCTIDSCLFKGTQIIGSKSCVIKECFLR